MGVHQPSLLKQWECHTCKLFSSKNCLHWLNHSQSKKFLWSTTMTFYKKEFTYHTKYKKYLWLQNSKIYSSLHTLFVHIRTYTLSLHCKRFTSNNLWNHFITELFSKAQTLCTLKAHLISHGEKNKLYEKYEFTLFTNEVI